MSLGATIRAIMGPCEVPVANLYRSLFIDLDSLVSCIGEHCETQRILEVGCGEGSLTQKLSEAFPLASITGIDIAPTVGRLYRGDPNRVTFAQTSIEAFAAETEHAFDLVVICDVLHHVPSGARLGLLGTARHLLVEGGSLLIKEWETDSSFAYAVANFCDRFLTGDDVQFEKAEALRASLNQVFGAGCIVHETRIPPRKNNIAFVVRPT